MLTSPGTVIIESVFDLSRVYLIWKEKELNNLSVLRNITNVSAALHFVSFDETAEALAIQNTSAKR